MPLKLNVGASKKVGEANYGSRGASVNIEMELDAGAVSEPAKLQERIRQLFGLVRTSLAEELNGNGQPATKANGDNGTGHSTPQRSPGRSATQSQVKAIHAIARSRHITLVPLLRQRFQVGRPDDLDIKQASALIDELKSNSNGQEGG